MSKRSIKTIIILVLLPVLVLQGCLFQWLPYTPPATPPPLELLEPPEFEETAPEEPPRPGQFTLRYNTEFTMNPIIARNRDNILLTSLLYESLFFLNENLEPEPLLCVSWRTEDNVTFEFDIMPNVAMHDGTTLTADDVSYSIRQAIQRGRHESKLRSIDSVSSDGELTVTIELKYANARFIRVLDIPVIKSGSIESRIPPGTGPFIFPTETSMRLNRFLNYRFADEIPLDVIHLRECSDSELTEMFNDGLLSMLWDDPTGAFDIRLNRPHEPRYYNTTAIQYIGFNSTSYVLRNPDVRRAIGNAIDRQYIVENIMNVPRTGQTVAAPVAISPIFDLYDPQWEHRGMDPLVEMAELLTRSGIADFDECSLLEIGDGQGGWFRFNLDFIVNIENAHKLASAHSIADSLRQFGFDINVRELQWNNFVSELEEGNFDMFYGETLLGADFDLTPLLLGGEDNLNFGRTGNTAYVPLIQVFLAAETAEQVSYAGAQLNLAILQNAPFIPILYKRYSIYTPMGVVTGASPGQSGVFYNFHDWSIDLLMLN